jgi:hypothetical protein
VDYTASPIQNNDPINQTLLLKVSKLEQENSALRTALQEAGGEAPSPNLSDQNQRLAQL